LGSSCFNDLALQLQRQLLDVLQRLPLRGLVVCPLRGAELARQQVDFGLGHPQEAQVAVDVRKRLYPGPQLRDRGHGCGAVRKQRQARHHEQLLGRRERWRWSIKQ
jgi:hypothetical protein